MEELLVLAILYCEDIIAEEAYDKKLNEFFLNDPENEDLLYLEWETDIKKAVAYIKEHIAFNIFVYELFGRIFMQKLKGYYENCSDIKHFAEKMYLLWENLPETIQDKEPFFTLNYADEPLSWGDEEQTRNLYENVLNYYFSEK